jgi:hypothetical protein
MLSVQIVCPKRKIKKRMMPFKANSNGVPDWWQNYNDTKHDLPEGAFHGNIGNMMNSLGALATLHDISHLASQIGRPGNPLEGENWIIYSEDIQEYKRLEAKEESNYKSRLFFLLRHYFG